MFPVSLQLVVLGDHNQQSVQWQYPGICCWCSGGCSHIPGQSKAYWLTKNVKNIELTALIWILSLPSVVAHLQALDEHSDGLLWAHHLRVRLLSSPQDLHCNQSAVGSTANRDAAKLTVLVPGTSHDVTATTTQRTRFNVRLPKVLCISTAFSMSGETGTAAAERNGRQLQWWTLVSNWPFFHQSFWLLVSDGGHLQCHNQTLITKDFFCFDLAI